MTQPTSEQAAFARGMRQVALVIAATTLVWLSLGEIGRQYGWEARFAFLIDLAAMAAYVWALFAAWQLWRKRRDI